VRRRRPERKGNGVVPAPELHPRGFNRVREVAFELHRVADALGLTPFLKTSGRTGLHCYIPIRRRFTYPEVREMAEAVGRFLEGLRPDDVTLAWSVRERTGKVFVDYNQNVRGKSLAAPFSPRRHPYGTVSMPITWDELDRIYPTEFTIRTVPDLLGARGDPWADILDAKADLEELFERAPVGPARR
jgi:bifunctional non-homologous end joining protein LigD